MGYGDYLEQLTYLIFLKMADEYAKPPHSRKVGVPARFAWPVMRPLKGAELEVHYVEALRALGTEKGTLGQIFTKAQNKIQDPAMLARVVEMVDDVTWTTLDADTKGDIYEGIIEKSAEDTKSGAGQYFTLRALIKAMVACVAPEPGRTIADSPHPVARARLSIPPTSFRPHLSAPEKDLKSPPRPWPSAAPHETHRANIAPAPPR